MATTGILQTGTYLITNAKNGNNVVQADDNMKAALVARFDQGSAAAKWNVTLLGNGNYKIVNYQYGNHSASTTAMATAGENVVGVSTRVQSWNIRETAINGNYIISLTTGEYFWGLDDDEEETPVTLASVPNNKKNQWKFTRVTGRG